MNIRTMAINALIATLYFVISLVVAPFGFLNIQFRISELFNHFIVFNKKFFGGIILGVFITNLFISQNKIDVIFGVAHSILSLTITLILARYIKNKLTLMVINSFVFSFNMYIIAYMLKVYFELPGTFLFLWVSSGISEFLTMLIAIPVILLLNKRVPIETLFKSDNQKQAA